MNCPARPGSTHETHTDLAATVGICPHVTELSHPHGPSWSLQRPTERRHGPSKPLQRPAADLQEPTAMLRGIEGPLHAPTGRYKLCTIIRTQVRFDSVRALARPRSGEGPVLRADFCPDSSCSGGPNRRSAPTPSPAPIGMSHKWIKDSRMLDWRHAGPNECLTQLLTCVSPKGIAMTLSIPH